MDPWQIDDYPSFNIINIDVGIGGGNDVFTSIDTVDGNDIMGACTRADASTGLVGACALTSLGVGGCC